MYVETVVRLLNTFYVSTLILLAGILLELSFVYKYYNFIARRMMIVKAEINIQFTQIFACLHMYLNAKNIWMYSV